MIELMVSDGEDRLAYRNGTPEFDAQVLVLREQFPSIKPDNWYSISTPQLNPIYSEPVVSIIYIAIPPYLHHLKIGAAGRKFFMSSGWVYDKVYLFLAPGQCALPLPAGGAGMYIGKLMNIYGQPGDEDLTRYQCVYFAHPDHAAVETWAGQSLPKGKYSTFYAATFDTEDGNRLLRVKTYVYDERGELFSNWNTVYENHCKSRGVGSN